MRILRLLLLATIARCADDHYLNQLIYKFIYSNENVCGDPFYESAWLPAMNECIIECEPTQFLCLLSTTGDNVQKCRPLIPECISALRTFLGWSTKVVRVFRPEMTTTTAATTTTTAMPTTTTAESVQWTWSSSFLQEPNFPRLIENANSLEDHKFRDAQLVGPPGLGFEDHARYVVENGDLSHENVAYHPKNELNGNERLFFGEEEFLATTLDTRMFEYHSTVPSDIFSAHATFPPSTPPPPALYEDAATAEMLPDTGTGYDAVAAEQFAAALMAQGRRQEFVVDMIQPPAPIAPGQPPAPHRAMMPSIRPYPKTSSAGTRIVPPPPPPDPILPPATRTYDHPRRKKVVTQVEKEGSVDYSNNCCEWALQGLCDRHWNKVRAICPKSCGTLICEMIENVKSCTRVVNVDVEECFQTLKLARYFGLRNVETNDEKRLLIEGIVQQKMSSRRKSRKSKRRRSKKKKLKKAHH